MLSLDVGGTPVEEKTVKSPIFTKQKKGGVTQKNYLYKLKELPKKK